MSLVPHFHLLTPFRTIMEPQPDLILMDINLPGTNGLSLLGMIRATEDIKNTKIIMSSGSDRKQESLQAGANSFLMKPYMPDDLIRMVKTIITV